MHIHTYVIFVLDAIYVIKPKQQPFGKADLIILSSLVYVKCTASVAITSYQNVSSSTIVLNSRD